MEISNDSTVSVHVECKYVNEAKGRANFDFDLTGKATASWDVRTQAGDHVNPPPFPTNIGNPTSPDPADPNRGELVCLATNLGATFQIAFNELTGTGTYLDLDNTATGVVQPREGFKYNAWAFAARCAPLRYLPRNRPRSRQQESRARDAGRLSAGRRQCKWPLRRLPGVQRRELHAVWGHARQHLGVVPVGERLQLQPGPAREL